VTRPKRAYFPAGSDKLAITAGEPVRGWKIVPTAVE
jgi:hypothetical protein